MPGASLYVGLMSGTSLDGVDGVLLDCAPRRPTVLGHAYLPFPAPLRDDVRALCTPGPDEVDRIAVCSNLLATLYADCVTRVLDEVRVSASEVRAIGCHGQTIRHLPDRAYTLQIGNPALLAERTGIAVVADFRSRDLAAGGQGAPLVPAFHSAVFASDTESRAVLNLGGFANLSLLEPGKPVRGFDTGPGNVLLDLWHKRHRSAAFDADGNWAGGAAPDTALLQRLLSDSYFDRAPPKSTGREHFQERWLAKHGVEDVDPRIVQATLLELTARTVVDALDAHAPTIARIIACGGGTRNTVLCARLRDLAAPRQFETSTAYGLEPDCVEAAAFAWLAARACAGQAGNLPSVTGAQGPRILGAIYPA